MPETTAWVAAGTTGDPEAVRPALGGSAAQSASALGLAVGAIMTTAGSDFEARPWRRTSARRRDAAHALQRMARWQLAGTALEAQPGLQDELLALPSVSNKVGGGPLARRSASDRARVVLREQLLDTAWLVKKAHTGGLAFDGDGSWLATAALTLLWRPTARHQPFPGPSVLRLLDDGRDLLEHAAAATSAGDTAKLLVHFGRASFFHPSTRELSEAITAFESASASAGEDGRGDVALAGLLISGLRKRDRAVADRALGRVDSRLGGSDGPRTVLWRAWAALLGGDAAAANNLLAAASTLPASLKGEAAEVLAAAGAVTAAAALLAGLDDGDRPGRHRLAASDAIPSATPAASPGATP